MSNDNTEDIKNLKEWLTSQPHLPIVSEFQLTCFLHSCHSNLDLTKRTIDNFFSNRTASPKLFAYPGHKKIVQTATVGTSVLLPGKTPKGCSIIFMKLLDTNPNVFNYENNVNLVDKTLYLMVEQNGLLEGVTLLIDWTGHTFGHIAKFNFYAMKNFVFYLQNSIPVRLNGLHIFNINSTLKTLFSLSKSFTKAEFFEMIFYHHHISEVFEHIPQELFPEEYGGKAPSVAALTDKTVVSIIENSKIFELLDSQKVDESKRPKSNNWTHRLFGLQSLFKKC